MRAGGGGGGDDGNGASAASHFQQEIRQAGESQGEGDNSGQRLRHPWSTPNKPRAKNTDGGLKIVTRLERGPPAEDDWRFGRNNVGQLASRPVAEPG